VAVAALLLLDGQAGAGFFEGEEVAAELGTADVELALTH
jgi:hypothetical protein